MAESIQERFERGLRLHKVGRVGDAERIYLAILDEAPDHPDALFHLGMIAKLTGHIDTAIDLISRALDAHPNWASGHNNLAMCLLEAGCHAEALAASQRALALQPNFPAARSNLLLSLNYLAEGDPAAVAAEHRDWARRHADPLEFVIRPHANSRDPERPLRVGYVSSDLRNHPVGRFLLPLIEHHDPQAVLPFIFSQQCVGDGLTERLRAAATGWREIFGQPDERVAQWIREDQIDILVDLNGHTAENRLLTFARKPAPIQLSFLGYPNTTGMRAMDFRLTDVLADPLDLTEGFCSEELLRIDGCAWTFPELDDSPLQPRGPGPITFGSFNIVPKVNEAILGVWARILQAIPDSRLLLKGMGWSSGRARARVHALMAEHGIAAGRLDLRTWVDSHAAHMALYHEVDIALDTFPYHGTTTTCEALWMGVPVITRAGQTHASRVGVSLLTHAGHPEWIATSEDEYIVLAITLARDAPRRVALRATLRDELSASPLMNRAAYARSIEQAYRSVWRRWCNRSDR
jgi:protein O-GlcNAc transferase